MDEIVPGDEGDGELSLHEMLAAPAENVAQLVARTVDWEALLEDGRPMGCAGTWRRVCTASEMSYRVGVCCAPG